MGVSCVKWLLMLRLKRRNIYIKGAKASRRHPWRPPHWRQTHPFLYFAFFFFFYPASIFNPLLTLSTLLHFPYIVLQNLLSFTTFFLTLFLHFLVSGNTSWGINWATWSAIFFYINLFDKNLQGKIQKKKCELIFLS